MPPIGPQGSAQGSAPSRQASREGYAFGGFRLELYPTRLLRNGELVPLAPRILNLLHYFVQHAGRTIEKDELITAVCGHAAVTENNLTRMVSDLRQALDDRGRSDCIRSVAGIGYRFVATLEPFASTPPAAVDLSALFAPDRDWGKALAALESLSHSGLLTARQLLEPLILAHPGQVRFRIVAAMTCALLYDGTRADPHPDTSVLDEAGRHAHEALRLNPHSADAMMAIALVFDRLGDRDNALTAARTATRIDDGNWQLLLCLSWIAWGGERERAARRVLLLNPGFPLAHFFIATVLVAREALDEAERHVDAGIASMATRREGFTRFAPIALYYLKGLLLFARDDFHGAIEAFDRELALESMGHIFSRECCANVCAAKALALLSLNKVVAASDAVDQALDRVTEHPLAMEMLEIISGTSGTWGTSGPRDLLPTSAPAAQPATVPPIPLAFERAMARAGRLVHAGNVDAAVDIIERTLVDAPPGSTGWVLILDPLLCVLSHRDLWARALGTIHERAL